MRFFLDQDQSCHWYIIPVENREEWNKWTNLSEDDEASWDAPEYAQPISGHPNNVEFTTYILP